MDTDLRDSKATIKPKKVNGKWQFLYLEEDPAIRWYVAVPNAVSS